MDSFKQRYMRDDETERERQISEMAPSVADIIWEAENVELVTVGIDIGSSTSHLMFARVHMQRRPRGCRASSSWSAARCSGSRRSSSPLTSSTTTPST